MFQKAIPIFASGKKNEMNTHIVLCQTLDSLKNKKILIAAASFYQLFVNDRFVSFGPCRAAGGHARIDEISLEPYHRENDNIIRIEVAGYACRSLSTVYTDSFVCAEIIDGNTPVYYTGKDFTTYRSARYLQKTERYSGQRHFTEIYDARENNPFSPTYLVSTEPICAPKWLERKAPYPMYRNVASDVAATVGTFSFDETLPYRKTRSSFPIDERWGRYEESEIPYKPYRWIQRQKQTPRAFHQPLPLTLSENTYAIIDLKQIESGFLRFCADVTEEADVVIGYSEYCKPDAFSFTDINCQNVLEYFLPIGRNEMMSFEPYTVRFAIILLKKGSLILRNFGVLTCEYDTSCLIPRNITDPDFRAIYQAAVNTFAHNAADIYMDCPSRERAGWLCDSYFTGIAEDFLFGKSDAEAAFLENYRLYRHDGGLPSGALPMCYPSDLQNNDRHFIPQWNMWYVLEVRDFILKRGHLDEKEDFRASVMGVVHFLEAYENEDGLLEDLPSWNFVEWSKANDWTKNVNYPTNFLYVGVLLATYELYGDENLYKKAVSLRENTKKLSFNGEIFIDHAIRMDGKLNNTTNFSEAGQYYAMLFGDISLQEEKYHKLKGHIQNGFSTFSEDAEDYGFVSVNAFIGRYLRMQTLLMIEEYEILIKNIRDFFLSMATKTGTLWEYKDGKGSKDHGFASYAAVALLQASEKI